MKIITITVMLILLVPLVYSIPECGRFTKRADIPCNIISSWKPDGDCSDYDIDIINESGITIQIMTWGEYIPTCNITFNVSTLGTYYGNSTPEDIIITVEGDNEMILSISIFLILINLVVFALPFFVRFSDSEAGNYVVKRMIWIGSILLLWFNTTIFRTMAIDNGLGIDDFLLGYWWIFTLAAFSVIFIMVYVMVVGATKLMKEAQLRERMGGNSEM